MGICICQSSQRVHFGIIKMNVLSAVETIAWATRQRGNVCMWCSGRNQTKCISIIYSIWIAQWCERCECGNYLNRMVAQMNSIKCSATILHRLRNISHGHHIRMLMTKCLFSKFKMIESTRAWFNCKHIESMACATKLSKFRVHPCHSMTAPIQTLSHVRWWWWRWREKISAIHSKLSCARLDERIGWHTFFENCLVYRQCLSINSFNTRCEQHLDEQASDLWKIRSENKHAHSIIQMENEIESVQWG